MKISLDLIQISPCFINPIKDRELDLRGNKIPAIENIGATKDQNDTLNLSENDIRVLGNFPMLRRLRSLYAAYNRIHKIENDVASSLPFLQHLILTRNNITELSDLGFLRGLKYLISVSFVDNPVTKKKHYRLFVVWLCPWARIIDFNRVRDKERAMAQSLFGTHVAPSKLAKSILETAEESKGFVPGEGLESAQGEEENDGPLSMTAKRLTREEIEKIREQINNATSLEEVKRLERLLQVGQIPSH